jgi:serpin B
MGDISDTILRKIVMKTIFRLQLICLLVCSRSVGAITSNYVASHTSVPDDNDIKTIVAGNTSFAFAFYSKLNDPNVMRSRENLFFSPYSISTALAMTCGGARGNTQKQIATALHFTLPPKRLGETFGSLQKYLIQENKLRGYQLLMANALWVQKGEQILKEFLKANNYFGAGVDQLDFMGEPEKSR